MSAFVRQRWLNTEQISMFSVVSLHPSRLIISTGEQIFKGNGHSGSDWTLIGRGGERGVRQGFRQNPTTFIQSSLEGKEGNGFTLTLISAMFCLSCVVGRCCAAGIFMAASAN